MAATLRDTAVMGYADEFGLMIDADCDAFMNTVPRD